MALHTDLPIYRKGVELLALAVKVQVQLQGCRTPRTGFAGPLKGAPSAARQSRFRDGRLTRLRGQVLHCARPCTSGMRAWRPAAPAAKAAAHAAFSFPDCFLAARAGGRKACRFRSAGARSANPFGLPPSWRVGAAVQPTAPLEATLAQPQRPAAPAVTSLRYTNWHFDEIQQPLVLNPEASQHSLVAWCWGEIEDLQTLFGLLLVVPQSGLQNMEVGDLVSITYNRLRPVAAVLEHLGDVTARPMASPMRAP